MTLPRYREYKDSGIGWLGDVPRHWEVKRLRRIGEAFIGLTYDPNDVVDEVNGVLVLRSSNVQNGVITFEDNVYVDTDIPASLRTRAGDILLCSRNGSRALIGKNAQIDKQSEGVTFGAFMTVFRSEANAFLRYVFNSALFSYQSGAFLTSTINQLTVGNLYSFEVPLPPAQEQTAIAAFLDRETGKIDALVAEQEKLIALLKEKRQAVISHAVTKDLDPAAPMKDSGIEWLGEVPAHWEICLLKRAFSSVDYGISDALALDGEIAVLRMGNISDGKILLDDLKYVNAVDPNLLLVSGDLLYNRTNSLDLIGKVGMYRGDAETKVSFASYLVRFRTCQGAEPAYFSYLLNTPAILGEARSNAFVAIGQCNLNPTKYGQIIVAIPPLVEQTEISAFLNRETLKLDALIAEVQRAIDLLKERRTALISTAVTGKIDVRSLVDMQEAA